MGKLEEQMIFPLVQHNSDLKQLFEQLLKLVNREFRDPILPPSYIQGCALQFPKHNCDFNLSLVKREGRKDTSHHTICPPEELKPKKASTHFGCLFQISHCLLTRGLELRNYLKQKRRSEQQIK
ncbi:hypothetical protein MJO28_008644 [Puccinia striiformis f. sp. tritici]|uniref:Uncharacterized protein n=1 Tax=Puccinia striiformis f. sp. tritici TaxID=168172 RepID=A0ACC0ECK7_9BASI|nr:hypothetical protein MJO28_008644 [Puccinia striiformis f. sp. tritici]